MNRVYDLGQIISPKTMQQPFTANKSIGSTSEVRTALLEARRVIEETLELTDVLDQASSVDKEFKWTMAVSHVELTLGNITDMLRKRFA